MRRVQLTDLTCALLCLGGLACINSPEAGFAPGTDFSSFHTWDWVETDEPRVTAPDSSPSLLESRLGRDILTALSERGYVRGRERPDFRVAYQLSIETRMEFVEVPRALYLLTSHHSSYWIIEGTDTERRAFEHLRLSVDVHDPSGKVVWKAAIRRRAESGQAWDLEEAVREVLARFPKARSLPAPPADSSDQLAWLGN